MISHAAVIAVLAVLLLAAYTPQTKAAPTLASPRLQPDFGAFLVDLTVNTFQAFTSGSFFVEAKPAKEREHPNEVSRPVITPVTPVLPVKGGESGFIMMIRP